MDKVFNNNYNLDTIADIYNIVGKDIMDHGLIVCPRGKETKELMVPKIIINNPEYNLAYNKDRKFNLMYALVESLMLFNNSKEVKYFTKFNANMANFSDDGILLHGAYGHRIANNLLPLVEHLKNDKDTRQAVLSIYTNDFTVKTKDVPCTTNLFFNIRNNKLNMVTTMRSNDIIWGLPYDIFMFTNLQRIVANTLHIGVGKYIHIPVSLHVYSEHYELLESMINDTIGIKTDQDSNIYEFIKQSNRYVKMIDGIIPSVPELKRDTFNMLLYKEILYKDKNASDDTWGIDNPEWANIFTKRWNKFLNNKESD